jgi:DNA-binding CsgD family transcriptional regulator
MINRMFSIVCSEDGKKKRELCIISNGKPQHKNHGSISEIICNYFEHLTAIPEQYKVEIIVSGIDTAVSRLELLHDELPGQEAVFSSMPLLTRVEREIAKLLDDGKSEKEISGKRNVSQQTTRNQCYAMYQKYHCHSSAELLHALKRLNLLD